MRHLILYLESPLMAFGGETIDNYGVIRWFPAASMLTGLLANALGWRRVEQERHQRLQDRLVFAARVDREPHGGLRITDFQTALLGAKDQGWTTRGQPEGRDGGSHTYDAPHLRYRDYFADMRVTVALRLEPDTDEPTLDRLAEALQEPARPLFIGRKPCLPSTLLFGGFTQGDTALGALVACPLVDQAFTSAAVRALWPDGEGVVGIEANRCYAFTDQRNWRSGLHGGGRAVCEGAVNRDEFSSPEGTPSLEREGQP
ncbi:MAG: type I-E CRISPR-associated protein Cas5/CasD [Chloroflexi bacterium]|nr:type I-E CRISPR-associated protein Cas5/CasD [Chloroflexota bacterium]